MEDNYSTMNPLSVSILQIVEKYEKIKCINGQTTNAPYWMNKMENGKVVLRGEFNGKGNWENIEKALNEAMINENIKDPLSDQELIKLSKRNRIGIDCSGYAYRILEYLEKQNQIKDLSNIFPKGINKTNANTLTSLDNTVEIKSVLDIKPLDLIRMHEGKHLLVVIQNDAKKIEYTHSSSITEKKGVHRGTINIIIPTKGLEHQQWNEKTENGNNYKEKYFNPINNDSVRRITGI